MDKTRAVLALASLTAASATTPPAHAWFGLWGGDHLPPSPTGRLYVWGGVFGTRPRAPDRVPLVNRVAISDQVCAAIGADDRLFVITERGVEGGVGKAVDVAVRGDNQVVAVGSGGEVRVVGQGGRVLGGDAKGVKIRGVACGEGHCVAWGGGDAFSWGSNCSGQLGLGEIGGEEREPRKVTVPDGVRVRGAACGGKHTVLLGEGDGVYACGDGRWAQTGVTAEPWKDGGGGKSGVVRFAGAASAVDGDGQLLAVAQVAAGAEFSAALVRDGVLWTWGENSFGQLGHHNYCSFAPPNPIAKWISGTAVACGARHACMITGGGDVVCIGDGAAGQLGAGTQHRSMLWRQALTATASGKAVAIAAGGCASAAIVAEEAK